MSYVVVCLSLLEIFFSSFYYHFNQALSSIQEQSDIMNETSCTRTTVQPLKQLDTGDPPEHASNE